MVILLEGEFSSMSDTWTQYLCLEVGEFSVVLSSRTYEHLGEEEEFAVESEDGSAQLPLTINGRRVKGLDYGSVVGTEFTIVEEISLSRGEFQRAHAWLEGQWWCYKRGFTYAWNRIETVLRSVSPDPDEPESDEPQ